MRINIESLNNPNKHYYWVIEYWPGFSPSLSYAQQAELLGRYIQSLDYIEKGWKEGKVAMAFQLADRGGIAQLIAVDSSEDFTSYLKTNEAHILLSPDSWRVIPMVDWDSGKDAFIKMISRLFVRAERERLGKPQLSCDEVDIEANQILNSGQLNKLFSRVEK